MHARNIALGVSNRETTSISENQTSTKEYLTFQKKCKKKHIREALKLHNQLQKL